jgi:mannose-6-phosphate isomerase
MEVTIFKRIAEEIKSHGLIVASYDFNRPWGGFFVIEEEQSQVFSNVYFDGLSIENLRLCGKLSPKILLVRPGRRLSWQYHLRRAETWKIIDGPVGVVKSADDNEREVINYENGDIVILKQSERHRLIGLKNWGVVAEFWQHTDVLNPSDEDDIVRVQDDYRRM